jgi:hypothetical protein
MKLVAHHDRRYFLFEIVYGDEGDPWAPYGRVYDRVSRRMFPPVSFLRLNEAKDFFEDWAGSEKERRAIEEEAAAASAG